MAHADDAASTLHTSRQEALNDALHEGETPFGWSPATILASWFASDIGPDAFALTAERLILFRQVGPASAVLSIPYHQLSEISVEDAAADAGQIMVGTPEGELTIANLHPHLVRPVQRFLYSAMQGQVEWPLR